MIETFTEALPPEIHHLATAVMREASERGIMLSVAESCTGGLLAAVMTDVEGCAHAFERGFVTYTDQAKQDLLAVPPAMIARHTAVSHEVAQAMATGALHGSKGHLAVSTTGFAGPGAPGEEPGLVFFGLAKSSRPTISIVRHFGEASRAAVRKQCLRTALRMMQAAMNGARDFERA
jgi:nicotinamide-nucleotide amidase